MRGRAGNKIAPAKADDLAGTLYGLELRFTLPAMAVLLLKRKSP